ncbi:MAG: CHRD domain-containing protein [Verrucomicrobia bacterium]|nr:CHRD domain-containing protein [Verrucomicrobiota bacterium]
MYRFLFALTLFFVPFLQAKEAIVFYALLSPGQEAHKLYMPYDKEAPKPYYKRSCQTTSPKNFLQAVGSATFIYYPDTKELHYAISYTGLSSPPIMMHLQLGFLGEEGPVLTTIFGRPYEKNKGLTWAEEKDETTVMAPKGLSGFVSGTYVLEGIDHLNPPLTIEEACQTLIRGGFYINIHTCLNQGGELRGQLLPLSFPQ